MDNIAAGIVTPLTPYYKACILSKIGSAINLEEAREAVARQKGLIG
jgi:hypothetical protein